MWKNNSDGKEDWAIGYPNADNNAGRTIVMFGKSNTEIFPSALNIYTVSNNYGIMINGKS